MTRRRLAQIQLAASAVMFSTAGLFVGFLHVDVIAILFWRSFLSFCFTFAAMSVRHKPIRPFDAAGLAAALLSAAATVAFIPALRLTAVANVAVIHGSLPLLSVALSFLILREAVSLRTVFFCAAAAVGAAITFIGSASSGPRLLGDGLAMLMTLCMALMTIAYYRSRAAAILETVALSNLLVALIALVWSRGAVAVPLDQGLILMVFALVQMTFGLLLYAVGSTRLPAPEAALISIAEVPLSTSWAWIAFGQVPAANTIAGGCLILIAVSVHLSASRGAKPQKSDE